MENIKSALQSNEVIKKLIDFKKNLLNSERYKIWFESVSNAKTEFLYILEAADFKNGGNLTATDLKQIFRLMKKLSANRSLNRLIYEVNGIDVFNDKLRNLYYGEKSLPERVDDLLKLKKIGTTTISHFLVTFDWFKYSFTSPIMKEVLDLDTFIETEAKKVALQLYSIADSRVFSNRTINYLTYSVIHKQIMSILDLDNHLQINLLLWKYNEFIGEEIIEEEAPYTSVSLEKDLQNYLAENTGVIEVGLKLIDGGKELDTQQVGRIDLLCKDKDGSYVVVELKKGRTGDAVIGQIQRYIGWVMKNFNIDKVRGIIIANEEDEKLDFAIIPVKSFIQVKYYQVKFEINDKFRRIK